MDITAKNARKSKHSETIMTWSMMSHQRIVIIALELLFILICLYLVTAYVYYIKFRQPKQNHHGPHQGGNPIFLGFVFFLIVFGLMKSSLTMLAFFIPGQMTSAHCDILERSYQGVTVVAMLFLYIFLWFRQYSLYRVPSLASLVPSWLAGFSKYLSVAIVGIGAGLGAAIILTGNEAHHKFLYTSNKCVLTTMVDPNTITLYVCYAFTSSVQASMFFLLFYILRRHQADMNTLKVVQCCSTSNKLHRVIKNCAAACVITITVDVITLVLYTTLPRFIPQPFFFFLWDLNYAANICCAIFCFAHWKRMLWPWRRTGRIPTISKPVLVEV